MMTKKNKVLLSLIAVALLIGGALGVDPVQTFGAEASVNESQGIVAHSCTHIYRINAVDTVVRDTPSGPNRGMIHPNAEFFPTGEATVNAGGFTWRRGQIIRGTDAATNGWRYRTMWVVTNRLTRTGECTW